MKKTIKLTESDLNRIIKKIIQEDNSTVNKLFKYGEPAKQGWERKRPYKGAPMVGEVYTEIKRKLSDLDSTITDITYQFMKVEETLQEVAKKIDDPRINLPDSKVKELQNLYMDVINKGVENFDRVKYASLSSGTHPYGLFSGILMHSRRIK